MRHRFWLPVAAAALLLLSAVPGRAQGTAVRPVAAWSFEDGAGANGLALKGDAALAQGIVGAKALRLPGRAGAFAEAAGPVLDTSRSYTVMACVKLARMGGFQTFVSVDGERISAFFLQLRDDSGEFALTVPPSDDNPQVATASSDIGPQAGVWYHVAGVYDSSARTLSLYVNGTLQQTAPCRRTWKAAGPLAIGRGRFGGQPVDFVNGDIDDVRVYDAPLPAADIRAVAQADLPASALADPNAAPVTPAALSIDGGRPGPRVSPMLYGLMTEEINYSYDGGLYGELIRNRAFKDDPNAPAHWSAVQEGGAAGSISLDNTDPLSPALPISLKVAVTSAARGQRAGAANDGYWGVPVKPNATYKVSFYARAEAGFGGPLTASLESADGSKVYAAGRVSGLTPQWKQFTLTLKTGRVTPEAGRFAICADKAGTFWLSLVSVFPPTYHNRVNGSRPDIMEKLAAMRPTFLRFPGGNYLEGNSIATRFDWKKTIGPLEQRPGHQGPWGYRSTDGLGLLEFLGWCEDLRMEPLLAVYAGYSLRGEYVKPGPDLEPYVQDALDEIEYVTGDTSTRWGAERAKNGHPAPFPLTYVEIGNEDWFDRSGSYDGRFAQFYDAIKKRYPKLQIIATTGVRSRTPDVLDEHYYRSARTFERAVHQYDNYDRKGPKIFVGEWASQEGRPTPNMASALGDAAWMTGMERNSDIVVMECYAPLFVNVNRGGQQWGTNLIGYDALTSYGSPSYYAQAMFGAHVGDVVLPATLTGGRRLYQSVTRDTKAGKVYVKLVNAHGAPQSVHVTLSGMGSVASTGTAITLSGAGPADTNTITEPMKLAPKTTQVTGLGAAFDYSLPPYSVTVLELKAR